MSRVMLTLKSPISQPKKMLASNAGHILSARFTSHVIVARTGLFSTPDSSNTASVIKNPEIARNTILIKPAQQAQTRNKGRKPIKKRGKKSMLLTSLLMHIINVDLAGEVLGCIRPWQRGEGKSAV